MKESFEKFLYEKIDPLAKEDISVHELSRYFKDGEFRDEYRHFRVLLFAVEGQQEKHEIMNTLHEKFRAIDEGKEVVGFTEGNTRLVENWNEEKGGGFIVLQEGKSVFVTIGDLLSDGAWGVSYKLSADTPREIKKRFVLTEAKRVMGDILDDQIRHSRKKHTGDFLHAGINGFEAEKFVERFFEKIIEDAHLPLKIEKADPHEDHGEGRCIDIILHVLGGGVDKKDIGIQLTTGRYANRKERKISGKISDDSTKHIDKRVVVQIPIKNCVWLRQQWRENGMLPGGPTKLWDIETKEMVFRGVLKDILPAEKINEMWEKVKAGQ